LQISLAESIVEDSNRQRDIYFNQYMTIKNILGQVQIERDKWREEAEQQPDAAASSSGPQGKTKPPRDPPEDPPTIDPE